ncbi:MAG TPA: hypothetical protein PKH27_01945 [Candidatus Desulfobacillus denitrificans]|nr:hypothetical protein [Candidatus Desulfobacillus denitrificans]HNT62880.1 hypothetical protein [Candidatus Desulfobacillus denitrificans]
MHKFLRWFVIVGLGGLLAQAGFAAGIAMITDASGRIEAEQDGAALGVLAELEGGAKLRLGAGAVATVLYLSSGEEYRLKGAGRFQIGDKSPTALQGAKPERHKLPVDAIPPVRVRPASVQQATIVMRSLGPGTTVKLLEPVSVRILDERPAFRWAAVTGAEAYRVQVIDSAGQPVAEFEQKGESAQLPEGTRLKPGEAYSWSVEARLASGRKLSRTADFAVLDADARARLARLQPAAGAKFSDRVAYALMLERYEAFDLARAEWRRLHAERPNEPLLKERVGE